MFAEDNDKRPGWGGGATVVFGWKTIRVLQTRTKEKTQKLFRVSSI